MNDIEKGIVSILISDFESDSVDFAALNRDDFESSDGKKVYDILEIIVDEHQTVDYNLVAKYLDDKKHHDGRTGKGGKDDGIEVFTKLFYTELIDVPPVSSNYSVYLESLKNTRRTNESLTAIEDATKSVNGSSNNKVFDELIHRLKDINSGGMTITFHQDLFEAIDRAEQMSNSEPEMPTGFDSFDAAWGEFWRSELHVLGGDSGHMKTTLSLNLIEKPLSMGKRVLWFDREMTKHRLLQYFSAIVSGVEVWRFRRRMLRPEDIETMMEGAKKIADWNFQVVDNVTTPDKMNELIYRMEPDITVIDNFQNMRFDRGEGFWAAVESSALVKDMAMDHNTALLLLSQITRSKEEVRRGTPPTVEQFFGTSGLKHNADVASIVHWKWKDFINLGRGDLSEEKLAEIDSIKEVFDVYHVKMRGDATSADSMIVKPVFGRFYDKSNRKEPGHE